MHDAVESEKVVLKGKIISKRMERGTFSICRFLCDETVTFPGGHAGVSFSIKGHFIPGVGASVIVTGKWDKPFITKGGNLLQTLIVEDVELLKIREQDAIIKYLMSIKGVGEVTACSIYNQFGDDTYDILDADIGRLLEVKNIGKKKFEVISKDYLSKGIAKELYTYLYKYDIPNPQINKIFISKGAEAINEIKTNPYSFCMDNMLSFNAAEKIAKDEGLDVLMDSRIDACAMETLKRAESKGHTFMSWGGENGLLPGMLKIMKLQEPYDVMLIIAEKIRERIRELIRGPIFSTNRLCDDTSIFYIRHTAECEFKTADKVCEILGYDSSKVKKDYTEAMLESEKKLNVRLSDEQRNAVQTVLSNPITVVTGGPGTGKTTFQKVFLDVFKKFNPEGEICMAAPTGRAARRMTESSGLPSKTLHQTLKLRATDSGEIEQYGDSVLDADLVVVDEVSMLDIFLSRKLFEAISEGTQIVCIGDIYQLPSVGAGAVLKSLIECNKIPVVRFTKIFRQAGGSCIAQNAAKINAGRKDIVFDKAFSFIEKESPPEIVEAVKSEYEKAVRKYGIDEVCVLTPYRRKTMTGVNQLNPELRPIVNPLPEKPNRNQKVDKMHLYINDKVMFTKNVDELTNGDVGYIRNISVVGGAQFVTCDFGDGRIVNLSEDDLKHLVAAYSTTIHKSQGSEYKCCIIIIDPQHGILLKRNLVYTAVTRAKEKVVLIGSKKAFFTSIDMEDTSTRDSQLGEIISKKI